MKNSLRFATQELRLVPFFHSLSGNQVSNLYSHMFREDVALGIMPIGGRSRRCPDFSAEMVGIDSDLGIDLINSISRSKRGGFKQALCDSINALVTDLLWSGSSTYEIYYRDGSPNLMHITQNRTVRLPWVTVQVVPRADREQWKKSYSLCSNSRIWYLSMPKSLGGRSGYMKTIKILNSISSGAIPEFARANIGAVVGRPGFNVVEFDMLQSIAINKAAKMWGWNRRDTSETKQTEYYQIYKMARFRFAQALLREHLVSELNKLFVKLGFKCDLSVSGLPTSDGILTVLNDLEVGGVPFNCVFEKTSC